MFTWRRGGHIGVPKQWNGGHVGVQNNETAAMLVSKTMKRRPCWCPKQVLRDLNSLLMQMLSFVPINLHRCWPREWKHSIKLNNHIYIVKNFLLFPRPRLLKRWINKASLSSGLFKSRLFFFLVGFATSRLRHLLGLCASSCTELKLASLTFKKLWQVEV